MSSSKKIIKNTLVIFLGQIFQFLLSVIFVAVIARKLGDDGYGKYSFAVGFSGIFMVLADIGLNSLAFRDIARDKSTSEKYLGNIIIIKLALSITTFVIMLIFINCISSSYQIRFIVYCIGAYIILTEFTQLFRFTFYAFEKMVYGMLVTILDRFLLVLIGTVILLNKPDIRVFSMMFIFVGIFSWLFSFLICIKKFSVPKIEVDFKFWMYLFKEAIPLGIMIFFTAIYQKVNITILSTYKGNSETGWYSASFNFYIQMSMIATAIVTAVFPRLSYIAVSGKELLLPMYQKCLRYLIILAMPFMVGMIVLADKIILLIYGSDFVNSVFTFKIIALALVFSLCNILLWSVLVVINKQIISALNLGLTLIGLIMLDIIFIPRWGYIGATVAQVGADIILFLISFYFVSKYIGFIPIHKILAKPLLASLGMGIVIFMFKEAALFFVIPFGGGIYFALLYLTKGLLEEDIQLINNIFIKNKS